MVLQHLRKLNNFNSYLAILSALDSAPIRRLEWQKQTSEVRERASWVIVSCRLKWHCSNHHAPCIYTSSVVSCRDWRNIAHWSTAPPHSEHTELLWLKWSLLVFRICEWTLQLLMSLCIFLAKIHKVMQFVCVPGVLSCRTWPLSIWETQTLLTERSISPNAGSSSTYWTACGASSKCKSLSIKLCWVLEQSLRKW